MGKFDTLGDVALEALDGLLQERLLLVGDALEGVGGLLSAVGLCMISDTIGNRGMHSTYAELNGNREEVQASRLGNGVSSRDTREIDVAGLNEALLTLDGSEDLLGKARRRQ